MSDDTTTIEITEDQRDELKEHKVHDRESYKSVMDRLLYNDEPAGDAADVDSESIADAVASRGMSLDASERRAIAEEVAEVLR